MCLSYLPSNVHVLQHILNICMYIRYNYYPGKVSNWKARNSVNILYCYANTLHCSVNTLHSYVVSVLWYCTLHFGVNQSILSAIHWCALKYWEHYRHNETAHHSTLTIPHPLEYDTMSYSHTHRYTPTDAHAHTDRLLENTYQVSLQPSLKEELCTPLYTIHPIWRI